jgi:hypothetical protein
VSGEFLLGGSALGEVALGEPLAAAAAPSGVVGVRYYYMTLMMGAMI